MNQTSVMTVFLKVIQNPYVIITVVGVILYMNFCSYVANYVKKAPKPKGKARAPKPAPAPKPEQAQTEGGSEESAEE